MFSKDEPNCLFGGMAAPSWSSNGNWAHDEGESSWLRKVFVGNKNNGSWLFKMEIDSNNNELTGID